MLGVKDPGRISMAWNIRPGFRGDLLLCDGCCVPLVSEDRVRNRYEPAMRCSLCAVCSVACLAWICGKGETSALLVAKGEAAIAPETIPAKEAKSWIGLWWKTPRLYSADEGLQCGLSGNRVAKPATFGGWD